MGIVKSYLHKHSWKLTKQDATYTSWDAMGLRFNGIVLSNNLNLFNLSLNLSTCILAFAIRLFASASSFVNFSRFPRNAGISTIACFGISKCWTVKPLSTNIKSPGFIWSSIPHCWNILEICIISQIAGDINQWNVLFSHHWRESHPNSLGFHFRSHFLHSCRTYSGIHCIQLGFWQPLTQPAQLVYTCHKRSVFLYELRFSGLCLAFRKMQKYIHYELSCLLRNSHAGGSSVTKLEVTDESVVHVVLGLLGWGGNNGALIAGGFLFLYNFVVCSSSVIVASNG